MSDKPLAPLALPLVGRSAGRSVLVSPPDHEFFSQFALPLYLDRTPSPRVRFYSFSPSGKKRLAIPFSHLVALHAWWPSPGAEALRELLVSRSSLWFEQLWQDIPFSRVAHWDPLDHRREFLSPSGFPGTLAELCRPSVVRSLDPSRPSDSESNSPPESSSEPPVANDGQVSPQWLSTLFPDEPPEPSEEP